MVVYKVDRLTRPLANFAKLVELFEAHAQLLSATNIEMDENSMLPGAKALAAAY